MTRIIDGDTIEIRIAKKEKVRLIGMNTPEVGEKWADFSTAHITRLLRSERVNLRFNPTDLRDVHGRLLAYVYRESDDLLINGEMIRLGCGEVYRDKYIHPLREDFIAIEEQAKRSGKGRWEKAMIDIEYYQIGFRADSLKSKSIPSTREEIKFKARPNLLYMIRVQFGQEDWQEFRYKTNREGKFTIRFNNRQIELI